MGQSFGEISPCLRIVEPVLHPFRIGAGNREGIAVTEVKAALHVVFIKKRSRFIRCSKIIRYKKGVKLII